MYERIVLAYDGKREGLIAVREGALLAKRCKAQVYLLSVVPDSDGARMAETVYVDVLGSQIQSYKQLLEQAVRTARQLGLDPVAKLVVGEPAPQIGAFAKEVKADLIVLGHQRRNILQRWWSGSSGAYVSDIVECSVLIGRKHISDEDFRAELNKDIGVMASNP